jgi:hypothetical protein
MGGWKDVERPLKKKRLGNVNWRSETPRQTKRRKEELKRIGNSA